jgi:hypothetical protein
MGCGASSKSVGVAENHTPRQASLVGNSRREQQDTYSNNTKNTKPVTPSLVPLQSNKKSGSAVTDSGISSNQEDIPSRKGSFSSQYTDNNSNSKNNSKNNKVAQNQKNDPKLRDDGSQVLKDTGLFQKKVVMKQNYALFEIVDNTSKADANSSDQSKLPPLKLLQREKTKPMLTAQELEEKIQRATEKREQALQQKRSLKIQSNVTRNDFETNPDLNEREQRLKQLRDRLNQKERIDSPRSKELVKELEKFRPKTPSNFRPEF